MEANENWAEKEGMKNTFFQGIGGATIAMAMLGSVLARSNDEIIAWGIPWGWNSAIQVPGDYDGDGVFDLAVYDSRDGRWYIQSLNNSIPTVSENQGTASGTSALQLTKFGGHLARIPIVAGSVTIFMRDAATSVLIGTFIDSGDGQLQGTALLEGVVPISGLGEINYATGAWYVNLALPGLTGNFTLSASYNKGTGPGGIITWENQWGWYGARPVPGDYDGDGQYDLAVVDPSSGKWHIKSLERGVRHYDGQAFINQNQGTVAGTSALPLRKISGTMGHFPIVAGSVIIFMRDAVTAALIGTFIDSGDGQLQGTALLEGVVPISGMGVIDYATGFWYVNLMLPGLNGNFTLSASYRGSR